MNRSPPHRRSARGRSFRHKRTIVASLLLLAGCVSLAARELQPIDEASWVMLGGIEQWVTIRGDDIANPALLVVHGGPGFAMSAFAEELAPLEADFTVVQWDQRGAGRTYGRHGADTPDLTIDRLAQDGIELATYLQGRLDNRKVILLGHSFGTLVGIEMVRQAPERFSAYVGVAQFASFQKTVQAQLTHLRRAAEASGDRALSEQLDAIGTPEPATIQDFFAINRALFAHLPADDTAFFARIQARAPEVMTPEELADWNAGREFSGDVLMPQAVHTDLFVSAPRLEVPLLVIQGSDDIYSPTAEVIAYFERVDAPHKELTLIEGAGHFPFVTHLEEFLEAMKELALPMAVDATSSSGTSRALDVSGPRRGRSRRASDKRAERR